MSDEDGVERGAASYTGPKTRWQENHGTLLMVFVAAVFLVGAAIIFYRQNRFVPVSFPDGDMIDVVEQEPPKANQKDSVTIAILGSANDFGTVKVALYDSEATFNEVEKALLAATLPVDNGEARWVINIGELPSKFAVAAFHDENGDDRLTRNRLDIPTERYGFSRDARGVFGPPSYKDCVISRPKAGSVIDVSIR